MGTIPIAPACNYIKYLFELLYTFTNILLFTLAVLLKSVAPQIPARKVYPQFGMGSYETLCIIWSYVKI